ncbi:S8 family peptidase [Nonomuraea sp. SBT364]|uniref:S8 family peptidase n=1 Tax=Nonomuraea sp. SBT364 TaxID=1580530 RepID=UPI00066EA00D|nr:S8 family serine peptidase [Nonomuraea sp. SBT364]
MAHHPRFPAVLAGFALAIAAAATPSQATPPPAQGPSAASPAAGQPATLTLITGDVVTYTPVENGVPAIGIRQAPRPDGASITFATLPDRDGGWLVLPSDAAALVTEGVLDAELFDVTTLAREGRAEALPLLVTYRGEPADGALTRAATALPGGENVRPLDSIAGAALTVKAAEAGRFWAGLRADRPAAGRSASGLAKVWLDRRLTASLDRSVPLIGAPAGWARGLDGTGVKVAVLDTGVDATHPDLAGKIVAAENFSSSPGVDDRQGHGTHVAATIAGSGSASGGAYKGVAPGASLLIGKVLSDSGDGDWSWAIAGMEWAAEQGADVVNMSLGSCCGDGTDPMSLALNELSDKHGTLFVAAAGNAHDPLTVGVPAAADRALAVGAVDKNTGTTLADFSSKGPRLNDAAVKPNLVAPGVDIVAARSASSSARPIPGNDAYTSASGTSMATPHVAGAAAILAQQHPGWGAAELRDALTSTAVRHDAHNWFEQGSGRVDVARAVTQQVFATAAVDFRILAERATRQVTYRNVGAEPVTLAVEAVTRGWSGKPAPDGAITLGADSVTVPPNGTATVDLTVDPAKGVKGAYGGWVTASAGDVRLVTPFGYYTGPAAHRLTISLLNSYGTKEFVPGREGTEPLVYLIPLKRDNSPEDPFNPYGYYAVRTDFSGDAEVELPAGDYEVIGVANESRISNRNSWVIENVTLDGDRTVTLDARDTAPIRPVTRERTEGTGSAWYVRTFTDRNNPVSLYTGVVDQMNLHVTPVRRAGTGTLRLTHGWALGRAVLDSATAGRLDLHPVYESEQLRAGLTQAQNLPVVSVGQGRASDFDGVDVTGKLVLAAVPVEAGDSPYVSAGMRMDQAAADARRRGAAGIVAFFDVDGGRARMPSGGSRTFHALGLDVAEGRALRAALAGGTTTVELKPYAGPEVVYRLRYDERGRVPAKPAKVDHRDLTRIDARYHADQPDTFGWEFGESSAGEEPGRITYGGALRMPVARTEYFGPADDRVTWKRDITNEGLLLHSYDRFARGERDERWFKAPLTPGAANVPARYPSGVPCVLCRDGDRFIPAEVWLDSDARHFGSTSSVTSAPKLWVDGREIAVQGRYPRTFTVPDGGGDYRLESVDTSGRTLSSEVSTAWRFASAPPKGTPRSYACAFGTSCAVQPALLPSYDLPLDLLNRAPAGRPFTFEVEAGAHASIRHAPHVKDVKVEFSADDGLTWQPARVQRRGGDRFRVTLVNPAAGFVSLRLTAGDGKGGAVTQTIKRAYGLR